MNTEIIGALLDNPRVLFGTFIAQPLAGAALAYGLVLLAMRPKDGRKIGNSFMWHFLGVAATVIGSAIFRIVAMVTFAGRSAYEPSAAGGGAGFYMLIVPAVVAAGYIAWLKTQTLPRSVSVVGSTTPARAPSASPLQPQSPAIVAHAPSPSSYYPAEPSQHEAASFDSVHVPPTHQEAHTMPEIEDRLYEQIAQEIETNAVDKGIWTKAFAQSGGDDKLTRVAYIKARFEKLMVVENARLEAMQHEREENARLEAMRHEREEVARHEQEQREREEVEHFKKLCVRIKVAESVGLDEAKKLAASSEGKDFINWCCWGRIAKVKLAVEKNRKRSTNPNLFRKPFRWLNPAHANSTATAIQTLPKSWLRASHAGRGATKYRAQGH